MKITIIVSYTYPYIGSGIGQVALKQAEYLAKKGNNVSLISSNIPKSKEKFYKNKVFHIKQKSSDILERVGLPVPLFIFNKLALKVIKEADIIHVHDIMYPSSFLASILAKLYNKRLIVTVHITHVSYTNYFLNFIEVITKYIIGNFILANAEKIIIVNKNFQNDQFLNKFQKKIVYIPNGVDFGLFKPVDIHEKKILRIKYHLPVNKPIVLFVGRFVEKKGYQFILSAKSDKFLTILIGNTKNQINIQKTNKIMIMGEMKQNKLADYYKMSDVFVLPSHGEGFPLSVQEAMACNIPVITTNLNIPIQNNENLAIYIKNHVNDISQKIDEVLINTKKKKIIIRNALKLIKSSFSWEENINKLNSIYVNK